MAKKMIAFVRSWSYELLHISRFEFAVQETHNLSTINVRVGIQLKTYGRFDGKKHMITTSF